MRTLVISSALVTAGLIGVGYYGLQRQTGEQPVVVRTPATLSDVMRGARDLPTTPRNAARPAPVRFTLPAEPDSFAGEPKLPQTALQMPAPGPQRVLAAVATAADDIAPPKEPDPQDDFVTSQLIAQPNGADQVLQRGVLVALAEPDELTPDLPNVAPPGREPAPSVIADNEALVDDPALPLAPSDDDLGGDVLALLPDTQGTTIIPATPGGLDLVDPDEPQVPQISQEEAAPEIAVTPVVPQVDTDAPEPGNLAVAALDTDVAQPDTPQIDTPQIDTVQPNAGTAPTLSAPDDATDTVIAALPDPAPVADLQGNAPEQAAIDPETTATQDTPGETELAAIDAPINRDVTPTIAPQEQVADAAPTVADTAQPALEVAAVIPVPDLEAKLDGLGATTIQPGLPAPVAPLPKVTDAIPQFPEAVALHEAVQAANLPILPVSVARPVIDVSDLETLVAPIALPNIGAPVAAKPAPVLKTAAAAPASPAALAPVVPDVDDAPSDTALPGADALDSPDTETADIAIATAPDVATDAEAVPTVGMQEVVYVTGTRVNLRTGPGTRHHVVKVEEHGAKLRKIEESGHWIRVAALSADYEGWMFARYLDTTMPEARPEPQPVAVVTQARQRTAAAQTTKRAKRSTVSEASARRAIIRRALATSSAECPCPFSRDRSGNLCGGTSVWNLNGGGGQICFDGDVSRSMIKRWQARN